MGDVLVGYRPLLGQHGYGDGERVVIESQEFDNIGFSTWVGVSNGANVVLLQFCIIISGNIGGNHNQCHVPQASPHLLHGNAEVAG